MRITKLSVTGLRALKQADFEFQPGMNLLVGVNGVGKTTVLEALCICLSRVLPEITSSRSTKQSFDTNDISIGLNTLQVSSNFNIENKNFEILLVKQKQSFVEKETANIRDSVFESFDKESITPSLKGLEVDFKKSSTQPLGIYFSTKRSILTDQKISSTSTGGGQSAAFAESLLKNRDFNLRIFAQWFKVQEEIGKEKPIALKHISVLKSALERFVPEFSNLHLIDLKGVPQLRIEKNGTEFDLQQLSDGERGILSIVFDIARRLSQANPELADPLIDGRAIVLIDELDLHLHPKWQRTIVENLTRTFPNCQFIATTHSPQILGEVKPENIIIIDKEIYKPSSSFGIDSSRVLEEILDTLPRNKKVNKLIEELNRAIDSNQLKQAKDYLTELIGILGSNDPDVTRSSTMISFLENDLANETN